ncbi:MAG TPA: ATP-binding protein [Pseudonocardia sp.]|jgi:PAS domain S-box-containing protein|nr:ATP-binding protein [Pseudonocardia sp.]
MGPGAILAARPELSHADSLWLLNRQARVLELVAAGAALPEVLAGVTTALEELIAGSRCSVLLFDAEAQTLHHGAAPTLPPAYSAAIDGLRIGDDAGSCGAAAFLDAQVVAEDIARDRRWVRFRDLALPHGLRACWSRPIRGRAGILGTFAVYHGAPHRPTEREHRLVERFSHLASVAIEHARLFGKLAESEERFRRAFEDNAVGMALTALDGRFGKVNRALQEMLGRSEGELLSADVSSLLHPDADPNAVETLRGVTDGGSVQFETTLARPDGAAVRVAVTASTVRSADGVPVYLSMNVLDVTARRAVERDRRARREAELAREVAEAASRAKSRFLSALSHEMRTPLQAITGFTELLGTLDLPPERHAAALGHIAGACAHILALVDDVLDIARIEANALPLHVCEVGLDELVGEVVALLQPVAAERGVSLGAGAIEGAARADRRRLRQVLLNLVSNAVRYNHAGGAVLVTAERDAEHEPAAGVTVRVSDSGPGIPEELLDRVFVPFDRLGLEDGPGSGLGMVLARGLTEAMGGRLAVHSRPGEGTTVEVWMPRWPMMGG